MPLKRYEIRNEYSLADPELYKVADKDDPEAILEGVAMAGLVGLLRQLGDLAEFAAEIFHDLHEEVMSTAARGHGLIVRVQQLELEFPLIERKLLSQTSHTSFLYNSSIDWHPNLRLDENTITQGDLPRFVMDSYEECRGPPRLFLLDKFDVAGAGACLKRFTDPSFFKTESASSTGRKLETQREKKNRRVKKRGTRWRNGETPESFPSSHAKLHQLFLEERIESGGNDPDCRVKLKKRQFTGSLFNQENTKSYMEKYLDTCHEEQSVLHENFDPLPLTWTSNNGSEFSLDIIEIGTVSPLKESIEYDRRLCTPDPGDIMVKPSTDEFTGDKTNVCIDREAVEVFGVNCRINDGNLSTPMTQVVNGVADRESKSEDIDDGCDSDDVASEMEDYVDALATIESEVDTDSERKKYPSYFSLKPVVVDSDGSLDQEVIQGNYMDSQSVGNSTASEDSECSNSVTSFTEIAADNNKKNPVHHIESERTGSETEKHAEAHMADLKIHDGLIAGQELKNVSDTSCHGDLDTTVHSVDMENSLIKNSLKMMKVNPSAEINDASGERDQGRAFDKTVPCLPMKDDNVHWSSEHSTHDEAGHFSSVYSDTSALLHRESHNAHSVCSSIEEHTNDTFAHSQECFIPSTKGKSEIPFSGSITVSPDFVAVHSSEENPGLTDCGQRPSSPHSITQVESSHSTSYNLQNATLKLHSSGNSKGIEEFGVDGIDSSENVRSNEISPRNADGEIMDGYNIVGKPLPSADLLKSEHSILNGDSLSNGEVDRHGTVNMMERNAFCLDFTSSYPDQTTPAKSDHAPNDKSEDGNILCSSEIVHSELQYKLEMETNDVTALEGSSAHLDFDVEKVDSIQAIADCTRSGSEKDDHDKEVDPLSSNMHSEQLQDLTILKTEKEGHINGEESTKEHRAKFNKNNHLVSVHDTQAELNLNPCSTSTDVSPSILHDGMLLQDIANSGKLTVDNPLVSENSFRNVEVKEDHVTSSRHDLLKLTSHAENAVLLNEHDISSVRDNLGMDIQTSEYVENGGYINLHATGYNQSEPLVSMPPPQSYQSEYETNLEAPPLPPLPPMQWRLGRFRNSSATPERAGQIQVQPMPLPGVHHALAPLQPVALPAVHYAPAPAQPMTLPAMNDTLVPVPPITLPTYSNEGPSGSSAGYVALQGGITMPIVAVVSEGFLQNEISEVGRKEHVYSIPSTSGNMALQGGFTLSKLATVSEGSSQDNLLFFSSSTSAAPQSSSYISENFYQLNVRPPASDGGFSPEHNYAVVEATANTDIGLLQKKPPRPRNPLIDEVVAIDKSKLRKVERVKPSLDSKVEEVESLLEQMQLRKVDKVKPPVETKAEKGGYILEQLQLRKVGERPKPLLEPKNEESEFLPKHMQLKKVAERFKPDVELKAEETESPRVQLRRASERVKPEVELKSEETETPLVQLRKVSERVKQETEPRTEETESPRMQLRKVENTQAGPKVEERDSLFEQIRNKSFNLKPAVAARPNIQGPRTNLKVAAILEKASNIRQAMVGSDEDDDDADTWE
ncbi:hypothetical protein KSS87_016383 [Heliosperma pusillum]|nr:hypothetical protein KSS87_016383 [Heliosperma pusillum]